MLFIASFELPLFPYYMYFIFDDIDVSCRENAWILFGSYVWRCPMSSFVLGCTCTGQPFLVLYLVFHPD